MLVHRRVTPSIKFAGTHLYTWVERGTVRVKCLAQEHNTMSPARARTRTARSEVERTNHEATVPPTNSNYIEVAHLNAAKSHSVIKEMKSVFARYGIPDVLVTVNGPQFASAEFGAFAKTWMFKHTTSSPHHPQSNGIYQVFEQ